MTSECMSKRIPWLTWTAIERVREIIKPNMSVLEWGCGGSTFFWLDSGCIVMSIEHNPDWMQRVQEQVIREEKRKRCRVLFVPASKTGVVTSKRAPGFFDEYANVGHIIESFDLVLVDGRARNECMLRALDFNPTYIILDNSDRTDYTVPIQLNTWHRQDFTGPGPDGHGVSWCTTIFENVWRPDVCET